MSNERVIIVRGSASVPEPPSGSAAALGLRGEKGDKGDPFTYIFYTDDTNTRVNAVDGRSRVRVVSSAGKTINSLELIYRYTERNLYFAGSGIFEGDVPASDFEPYD